MKIPILLIGLLALSGSPLHALDLYVGNNYPLDPAISLSTNQGSIDPFLYNGSSYVTGLAFNGSGQLYFENGSTISRITDLQNPSGSVEWIAGGINYGGQIAFDSQGNLFAADGLDVKKIAPDGTVSVFYHFSSPQYYSIYSIAIDAFDNIYVDGNMDPRYNGLIEKITPSGVATAFATRGGAVFNAAGLTFDSLGNLYALNDSVVLKITPGGDVSTYCDPSAVSGYTVNFQAPYDLKFDSSGNLYVANAGNANGNIVEIGSGGTTASYYIPAGTSGMSVTPEALAITPVPEPSAYVLFGIGTLALMIVVRRRGS